MVHVLNRNGAINTFLRGYRKARATAGLIAGSLTAVKVTDRLQRTNTRIRGQLMSEPFGAGDLFARRDFRDGPTSANNKPGLLKRQEPNKSGEK